jgi:lipid-binding SYLF domain-containing protein
MFLVIGLAVGLLRGQEQRPDHRLSTAATVLHEILAAPDKGIPEDLLARAQCVMIVPGLKKGAFLVGGEYGRGFAVCRRDGMWGGPAAIKLDGTVVSQDGSEDRKLYGYEVRNQGVLKGEVPAPPAARTLISELDRYSPGKR